MRPRATWRDVLWLTAGALVGGWFLWDAAILLLTSIAEPSPLGALFAVAWGTVAFLVAAGAWRRTVWGCQLSHDEHGNGHRPCPRHERIDDHHAAESAVLQGGPMLEPRHRRMAGAAAMAALLGLVALARPWGGDGEAHRATCEQLDAQPGIQMVICDDGEMRIDRRHSLPGPATPQVERRVQT